MYDNINLIQEEKRFTRNIIKLDEIICFPKFSSYDNLVRVLAYVKRFIFNCSRKCKNNKILDKNVNSKEFSNAEIFQLFYEKQHFSSKEQFYHSFNSSNIFTDKDGLIKIKRRLQNTPLNLPIILKKDSYVTHLIIWKYHISRLHSGVKDTLNHLRQ